MQERYDVAVIGGGPAGGFTAGLIARSGYSVAIIEEHGTAGEPVQCAGLITPRCFDILGFGRKTILNEVRGADIMSQSGQLMRIGKDCTQAVVVDRAALDRSILNGAADAGATLITGKRIREFRRKNDGSISMNNGCLAAKLMIGADGAKSATRAWLGLAEPTHLLNGIGADITGVEMDPDRVKLFFGRDIAPNFFAWMIPAGDFTRLGLCVRNGEGTVHDYFKKLFKNGETAKLLAKARILKKYSGMIPLGMLPATHADSGMIVGDAACQVKATSGGGIYPGLVCAGRCAETAITALESGDLTARALARYHDAWTREIGQELDKALMMHSIYADLDNRQLEDIFGMMLNPDVLDIINKVGDIDYPSKLGWALLKKEPGLLRYAGKFLRHGVLKI